MPEFSDQASRRARALCANRQPRGASDARRNAIWEIVRERALEAPRAIAIAAPDRLSLSYGVLEWQINTVAGMLAASGIRRHHRVALVMPNGPGLAAAVLAIAACAACVPINPDLSTDELNALLADLHGMGDNFFALGGDSLQAARASARIRSQLGAALDLGAIFTGPRIWQIAAAVVAARPTDGEARSDGAIAQFAPPRERDPSDGPEPRHRSESAASEGRMR